MEYACSAELRARIKPILEEDKQKAKAMRYVSLAVFILVLYVFMYVLLLEVGPQHGWVATFLVAVLVLLCLPSATLIMHNASHDHANSKLVSAIFLGITSVLLNMNCFSWRDCHVGSHHRYNSVFGKDENLAGQLQWFRLYAEQPRRAFHRYQHWYFLPLLGCVAFAKMFSFSFLRHSFSSGKARARLLFELLFKALHYAIYLAIPMLSFSFWHVFVAYIIFVFCISFIVYFIIALGHVAMAPIFQEGKAVGWLENHLRTTCNFSMRSKLFTFLSGGLNYHIEHHVAPRLSNAGLKKLSGVLQSYCTEKGLAYVAYPTMYAALKTHLHYLKQFSN